MESSQTLVPCLGRVVRRLIKVEWPRHFTCCSSYLHFLTLGARSLSRRCWKMYLKCINVGIRWKKWGEHHPCTYFVSKFRNREWMKWKQVWVALHRPKVIRGNSKCSKGIYLGVTEIWWYALVRSKVEHNNLLSNLQSLGSVEWGTGPELFEYSAVYNLHKVAIRRKD